MQTTSENVTKVKQDVETLDEQVQEVNTVIADIPNEYVKNSIFESYKEEINQKLGSVYTVKGSVANYEALMDIENKNVGDVYNLLDTGANYVYTDSGWDKLSETIDFSNYYTKEEIDEMINQIKGGTT
mgnify:CR=1 FL=1